MNSVIQTTNLSKNYGNKRVLDSLMVQANPGDIVGLIGPNGAGKSTAMKIIMRLICSFEGQVTILGKEVKKSDFNVTQNVGFTSESPSFYNYLSGYENLAMMANLYPKVSKERIIELLGFVGLKNCMNQKVKTYSTGMKQRLGLARALLNNPMLLILDEPTNGLDPSGIWDIYHMLKHLALSQNIAILISSHQLHDMEKVCNKVVMLNHGKTVYNGTINELGGNLEESYFSFFEEGTDR